MKKMVALLILFLMLSMGAIAEGIESIIPDASIWGISIDNLKETYKANYEQCQVGEDAALRVSDVVVCSFYMDVYYVFDGKSNTGLSKIAYILNTDYPDYEIILDDDEFDLEYYYQSLFEEIKKIEGEPDSIKKTTAIWKKENYKTEFGKGKLSKYTGSDDATVAIIFKHNSSQKPTNTPKPTKKPKPTNTPKPSNSVYYSTNTKKTVKNGNSGIYSYIQDGYSYDNYYIIDFNNRYVYWFSDGNGSESCERVKMVSGDLNDVLIITYHDGDDIWSYGLHFKWVNQPDHLILQDNDGFTYDYYPTDLDKALEIMHTKKIYDY